MQEGSLTISQYVGLYTIEGVSETCGRRIYHSRITFDDAAHTIAEGVEILLGPYEESSYREKALEFIRFAQAGDVQQMLAMTSPLSYARESDSVQTIYAEQVVPEFQGTVVTWESRSMPGTDERTNVGFVFTGTARGKKRFSFEIVVYKESGKLVVANIRKQRKRRF